MSIAETLTVADRLALTLQGLCRAVAARIVGGAMAAAMILLVWRRVQRVEGQMQGLLARFRAGRLWVLTAPRMGGGGRRGGGSSGLPRGFGWLLPLVPQEAACFAGQMRGVLAEPEMVALLAAAPQARRVLRPLCRMLGIEASVLAPGGVTGPEPEPGAAVRPVSGGGDPPCGAVLSPPVPPRSPEPGGRAVPEPACSGVRRGSIDVG